MTSGDPYLAASRFLASQLTRARTDHFEAANAMGTFENYLDAFEDLGVMSATEAKRWRERMSTALSDDGRVLGYIARPVGEALERSLQGVPRAIPAMSDEAIRLNALLTAVRPLQPLPEGEANRWAVKIQRRLTFAETPPAGLDQDWERWVRSWSVQPGELMRVVPGSPERRSGLRIVSVLIYERVLAVRWHFVSKARSWPTSATRFGSCFELRDDLGTEFAGRGGGGSRIATTRHGETVVIGEDHFVPVPPPPARSLTFQYAHAEIGLELPSPLG